jgi:hypothetical protein
VQVEDANMVDVSGNEEEEELESKINVVEFTHVCLTMSGYTR